MKINDFGEKIGGSRKDLINNKKILNKSEIWERPNYNKLLDSGINILVLYFYKLIRDSLPNEPIKERTKKEQLKRNKEYTSFISDVKKATLNCKNIRDIKNFYKDFILKQGYVEQTSVENIVKITDKSNGLMNEKLLKNSQVYKETLDEFKIQIKNKNFCATPKQKILNHFYIICKNKNIKMINKYNYLTTIDNLNLYFTLSKKNVAIFQKIEENTYFVLNKKGYIIEYNLKNKKEAEKRVFEIYRKKQNSDKYILNNLKRKSPIKRERNNIEGKDFIKDFNIKGGEFGSYLSNKERQQSLNYAYDAFKDLAYILGIKDESIGLNHHLSISFGARGYSHNAAHYEQDKEVINLTKLKGFGSLAHEYFHALDNILYKKMTKEIYKDNSYIYNDIFYQKEFLTNNDYLKYKSIINLLDKIKYNSEGETNFYKNSKKLDNSEQEYWSKNVELVARAFECYIFDKLKENKMRNDYLVSFTDYKENNIAYPKGNEKEEINKAFDLFFKELKDLGLLKKA